MIEVIHLNEFDDVGEVFNDDFVSKFHRELIELQNKLEKEKLDKKEFRKHLLQSGDFDLVRKTISTYNIFVAFREKNNLSQDDAISLFKSRFNQFDITTALNLRSFFIQEHLDIWNECELLLHNFYKRLHRAKTYISCLLKKPCVFVTLTFSDETLNRTKESTRRQFVFRFLNSFDVPYIANVDYGEKNGREHYHCVLQKEFIDALNWNKYGLVSVQHIRNNSSDATKLAKYINKLSYHTMKESNRTQKVIYSKKKPNGYNGFLEEK